MLGLIVASHGNLSKELIKSSYLIFGQQEKVVAVTFEPAEDINSLKDKYKTNLKKFAADDRIIFLCDLYGGNPLLATKDFVTNDEKRFAAIGGVNLAMLIEAYTLRESKAPLAEIVDHLVAVGKSGINSVRNLEPLEWM